LIITTSIPRTNTPTVSRGVTQYYEMPSGTIPPTATDSNTTTTLAIGLLVLLAGLYLNSLKSKDKLT